MLNNLFLKISIYLVTHIYTRFCLLAVELLSTVRPLCSSQCLYGTILMTLCLMVLNWQMLRAEPMPSCWPYLLFVYVYFYSYFFHGLVVWVGVFGPQPCTADSFLIIIIHNKSQLRSIFFQLPFKTHVLLRVFVDIF